MSRRDQLARASIKNPDVAVGDEQLDRPPLVGPADADVMELAVVAQGDGALASISSWRMRKCVLGRFAEAGLALSRAP